MKTRPVWLVLLLAATLSACSVLWAQALSRQMADALLSMQSYHGTLVQDGLLPDQPDTPVVQEIWYQTPWRIRAEVTSPEALKGSLFLYDGEQVTMWWPGELLGIRVRGLPDPDRDQVVAHLAREIDNAMAHYAFALQPDQQVAGETVDKWRILPLDASEPWRLHHTTWNHTRYALPLKMTFERDGQPWYAFHFDDIRFDVPVPDATFDFTFPDNALVFDWDMAAPGIAVEEARRTMNFEVLEARDLPPGHTLNKIVRGSSCLPMVALDYSRDASVLMLTQSRAYSPDQVARYGKPVPLGGERTAWLYFAGSYSVLTWVQGRTLLTLTGNLSFPQLIDVARSVR